MTPCYKLHESKARLDVRVALILLGWLVVECHGPILSFLSLSGTSIYTLYESPGQKLYMLTRTILKEINILLC